VTLLSALIAPFQRHISLMHGWVPITVQAVAAALLVLAIGWRSRRWRMIWLPVAALLGIGAAGGAHWYIASGGLADDPAPHQLWIWIALTGLAAGVLALGWRGARWWRRVVSVLAVPLCLLSAGLALNFWVGYFPTVQTAWNQLTAGPLPDQTSRTSIASVVAQAQARHALPAKGSVVPVDIPATASKFRHRGEVVYLPPAWFATTPPPKLPTVMMIGGEFNTPADWLRAGNAIATIDTYAAAHHGAAPVFVFVDSGGAFNNDTECVNGPRGNAADHLTKDVVPYMETDFGVSGDRDNWGIVGWSMGGTCAVDLATMHPDTFSSIVDIAGDIAPNTGTRTQTVDRLFGGDAAAWATFDPATVITKHGHYQGISAWFGINGSPQDSPSSADATAGPAGLRQGTGTPSLQAVAANTLCALGTRNGIDCAVIAQPGKHDWQFAARVFAASLPWLAGALHTPGAPAVPLRAPGHVSSADSIPLVRSNSEQSAEAAGR